eukprot:487771_1
MSYPLGTVVALKNGYTGTIKYIGKMRNRTGKWYGMALTTPNGNTDGMDSGRYYFITKDKYGIFVKKKQIKAVLSSLQSAKKSAKRDILRSKSIHLFNSSTELIQLSDKQKHKNDKNKLNNHNKYDEKDDEKSINSNTNKQEIKINNIESDYESSITHIFLHNCLPFLISYLDNNTIYSLLHIQHFTSFYDITTFFNCNLLQERLINDPQLHSKYTLLRNSGIVVSFWDIEPALKLFKNNKYAHLKVYKQNFRRNRFLVFVALQHMIHSSKSYYHKTWKKRKKSSVRHRYGYGYFGGGYYHRGNHGNHGPPAASKKKIKAKIIKSCCRGLKDHFIKNYNDFGVLSNDLISIRYNKTPKPNDNSHAVWQWNQQLVSGSARIFKRFKSIFNEGNNIAFLRGRKNIDKLIEKLENLLITPVTDLLVKCWILVNTKDKSIVLGYIAPKCVVVIYGGELDVSWWG